MLIFRAIGRHLGTFGILLNLLFGQPLYFEISSHLHLGRRETFSLSCVNRLFSYVNEDAHSVILSFSILGLEHWKTQVLTYAIFYPGC